MAAYYFLFCFDRRAFSGDCWKPCEPHPRRSRSRAEVEASDLAKDIPGGFGALTRLAQGIAGVDRGTVGSAGTRGGTGAQLGIGLQ